MSKRILLVEDEEDNMQIRRDLLVADYETDEAGNREKALAAVAGTIRFDVLRFLLLRPKRYQHAGRKCVAWRDQKNNRH